MSSRNPATSSPRRPDSAGDRAPRHEINATVTEHRAIIGHEFEIIFHAPAIAHSARPGQFVEILFGDNYAPLVRRPFSMYRVDRDAGTFSVLYLARGAFTSGLARKREGDVVSLLGPLGRPFDWPDDPGMQHILVAGGLGAPPLYFLASELSRAAPGAGLPHRRGAWCADGVEPMHVEPAVRGGRQARGGERTVDLEDAAALAELARSPLVVINAARTESLLVGLSEFGELDIALHVMTDDGSRGARGMATELLTALLDAERRGAGTAAVYACGPMPMLRSVGDIAVARGIRCQLSIETTMPCGIGLCQGCATKVRDADAAGGFRYALACTDGPVFDAAELIWS